MADFNLLDQLPGSENKENARRRLGVVLLNLTVGTGIASTFLFLPALFVVNFELLGCILLGFAQVASLSWIVFFTLSILEFSVRIFGVVMVVAVHLATVFCSESLTFGTFELWEVLSHTPLIVLGVALPFLVMRCLLGWHIVLDSFNQLPKRQCLTVKGMMVFTALVAFSVVFSQLGQDRFIGFVSAMIMTGIGFAILVPYVYYLFRSETPWAIIVIFTFIVGAIAVGFSLFFGDFIGLLIFAPGTLLFGATIMSLRMSGARLITHNDKIIVNQSDYVVEDSIAETPDPFK